MPCQPPPPLIDYSNYILRRIQVMELLIMQFSKSSYYAIPLRSKYIPQHLVLNTFSLRSSVNVRAQPSNPYITTGKIILFSWIAVRLTESTWYVASIGPIVPAPDDR
jgi:hypothetical protein